MCKKILTITAALAMVFSLAACNSAENETSAPTGTTGSGSTTTPSQTQKPAETTTPAETTLPETTGSTEESTQEITLVENEDCTVKITGYEEDGVLGYGVKVFLENKTDDNLMFSVSDVSVNGYMIDPLWAVSVAPGKMANDQISFLEADFQKNGIETVEEITFTLRIYDSEDWNEEDVLKATFTVNP